MSAAEKRHPDLELALTRRKQVLDAAAGCFSRKGFHGASMADISKAAGMSAGHIYNYFDGKDAIIAAFVQQNTERVAAHMRDLEQQGDPLQSIIDNVGDSVRESVAPAIWVLPMEIFSESARNPQIAALLQGADRRARIRLRAIIKAARIKRGLAADDGLLDGRIETILALYQGLHVRALQNPAMDVAAMVASIRLAFAALLLR